MQCIIWTGKQARTERVHHAARLPQARTLQWLGTLPKFELQQFVCKAVAVRRFHGDAKLVSATMRQC